MKVEQVPRVKISRSLSASHTSGVSQLFQHQIISKIIPRFLKFFKVLQYSCKISVNIFEHLQPFWRFSKDFPKLLQNLWKSSNDFPKSFRHSPNNFQIRISEYVLNIAENCLKYIYTCKIFAIFCNFCFNI